MVGDTAALLTPSEVAGLFRVCVPTVTAWARGGKLTAIRALGGHRRYPADKVLDLLAPDPAAQMKAVELEFPDWQLWKSDTGICASFDMLRDLRRRFRCR